MQWTWTWANFGRWWGTGRPGVLQSILQRIRHDSVTEQQQWHSYGNNSGGLLLWWNNSGATGENFHNDCAICHINLLIILIKFGNFIRSPYFSPFLHSMFSIFQHLFNEHQLWSSQATCQAGWSTSWNQDCGRNINNLRYTYDTTLMAGSKEELKSLLVKGESEKADLKLNIQKTKVMESGHITPWQIDGERMDTVKDFYFHRL